MKALCAALACMSGRTEAMPVRSLLSNSEGFVTVIFKSDHPIEYMAYCWTAIRRVLSSEAADNIRGMQVGLLVAADFVHIFFFYSLVVSCVAASPAYPVYDLLYRIIHT